MNRPVMFSIILAYLAVAAVSFRAIAAESAPAPFSADFFVSPQGHDQNPGSEQQPFRTLDRARNAVRDLKQTNPNRDLTVAIRGGTYTLRQTVVFSTDDSAAPGHTITYAAYPGERPVLSSGLPVTGWQLAQKDLPRQASAARGKLYTAPVPGDVPEVRVLFDGGQRLPRARGRGFAQPTASDCTEHGTHLHHMHFPPGAVPPWSPGRNWELVVVPMGPWVMNILPITAVDNAHHVLQTDVPATYSLVKTKFGHFPGGTAWIENAIECLDQPGEWVFDAAARRIYLWPRNGKPSENIVAPLLSEYIRIEGHNSGGLSGDNPVRGLVFRGLTFTHGNRLKWQQDKAGRGLQHDWEMFDRPTAMLRLRSAELCTIEACRFANGGGAGIRLDLYAQRNLIRGNLIEHLAGVGVLLAGYGPGLKDVNRRNEVVGNHIHHVGELLWHSPAVFVWQSGENRVAGNLIHHCPYTAIVVSGRIIWDRKGVAECSRTIRWEEVDKVLPPASTQPTWSNREQFLHGRRNTVEGNEIYEVMETLGDGNCIYISGTGGQNVVRANYLHDVSSPNMNAAIRCDDDQHGTTITGNLVWRTCGEGFINKGNNTFTNNIVADLRSCAKEQGKDPRGFIVLPYGEVKGAVIQRNIFYCTDANMRLLFEGGGKVRGLPRATLSDCKADQNLYFCTENPRWADEHLREQCRQGVECASIEADPQFADPAQGDFSLLPDSPALKLGFVPLSVTPIDRTVFPFNEGDLFPGR